MYNMCNILSSLYLPQSLEAVMGIKASVEDFELAALLARDHAAVGTRTACVRVSFLE